MRGLLAISLLLAALPAKAAPRPPTGNFALDATSCRGKDYFVRLSASRLASTVLTCDGLTYHLQRESEGGTLWIVDGRACTSLRSTVPRPLRFQMEARGQSLRVIWPDSTRDSQFLRCNP